MPNTRKTPPPPQKEEYVTFTKADFQFFLTKFDEVTNLRKSGLEEQNKFLKSAVEVLQDNNAMLSKLLPQMREEIDSLKEEIKILKQKTLLI